MLYIFFCKRFLRIMKFGKENVVSPKKQKRKDKKFYTSLHQLSNLKNKGKSLSYLLVAI